MLEGQSCLISRALPSSCEQESKWVYMTYRLIEVSSNGKRRFEEEEEGGEELMGERKSSKRIDLHEKEEMIQQPNNLSLSLLSNRSDQKGGFDSEEAQMICELPSEEEEDEDEDEDEDEEDVKLPGEGELSMQMDTNVRDEMTHTLNDLSLSLAVTSDLQDHHSVDQIDINCMHHVVDEGDEVLQEGRNSANPEDVYYGYQAEANYELPVEHKREAVLLWKGESSKPMDMDSREDIDINTDLSLSPADQSSQRGHDGDQSDMESLIQSLGRDISIDCLLRCSRSDYNSIAQLNRSFRDLIRYGELYRLRRQKSVIEHWVYFSCHSLEWEAFDPISRRWMHLPRLPSNECFMWSDKESLAVGTELLVFGREFSSLVIWRYSILTNSWSSGMQMNAPRCLFGSASFGEIAILAGGCDLRGKALNTAELYNSETGTWEILPSMNKPRKMCSGVFMDGKFYVIGGKNTDKNTDLLSCGEEYNLETRTWREIPNMFPRRNEPSEAPPLVAVVNNELYAADYADNVLRKYDKERVLWVTVGRLPARAASMNGWGLAFRACGEHLIVIGGPRATGGGIIELNSWIPREGPPQWNLLASKHSASFVYNCAVMGC